MYGWRDLYAMYEWFSALLLLLFSVIKYSLTSSEAPSLRIAASSSDFQEIQITPSSLHNVAN